MKKTLFTIAVIVIFGLGIFSLLNFEQKINTASEKLSIVTTLFPQHDFVKAIGGDKIEANLLLPPGIEAHAYEPKPSDITKINNAKIFIYTSELMESWAGDIIKNTDKKVKIVEASSGIELIKDKKREQKNEEEYRHYNEIDPHIWLDFDNAKIMAENIAKALSEVDPQNYGYYQNNLIEFKSNLTKIDKAYKKTLSSCKSNIIIYGGHYTFGYLAKRYNLKYISAQGFSPDSEPTAKDMIDLVEQIKKNNIGYIFYEELTSPKIAETLAKETNAKLLLLNGSHNLAKKDYQNRVTFISLMEANLKNLSLGLTCFKKN